MLRTRLQNFVDTLRDGLGYGFTVGLVILFLILIGLPVKIQSLALISILLVMFGFGIQLARKLSDHPLPHIIKNALSMGVTAAVMVFLFMSLINYWLANGTDVSKYFDAINAETMQVLSGVPAGDLHANPERDLFTGEYPEGAVLRTNPMRLTFDRDTSLQLFGNLDLIIGGFYGFMLVLIGLSVLGSLVAWSATALDVNRYRKEVTARVSDNPISHWVLLVLPLVLFALLWLTEGQGENAPIIDLGARSLEIQLLIVFGIILFVLVALRSVQPNDWNLSYPIRLGVCVAFIGLLTIIGILRVVDSGVYLIATSEALSGSETASVVVIIAVGVIAVGQNVLALRVPGRFETQFAGTIGLLTMVLMPMFLDQYQNDVLTLVGINILLGLGLNIVIGYAGLLDLGYVAFFALGAYAYAFLSSNQLVFNDQNEATGLRFAGNDQMVVNLVGGVVIAVVVTLVVVYAGILWWRRRQARADEEIRRPLIDFPTLPSRGGTALLTVIAIGASAVTIVILNSLGAYETIINTPSPLLTFLIGLLVGTIVAGLAGITLGIPVLRLRGDYLAIVTLGFGEIIRLLFNNLSEYTGGPQGIIQIPRPLPEGTTGSANYLAVVYLVFLGAGLVAFFSTRLKASRTGRAWTAMRSDEDIAQSMGINLVQSKLTAFAIGAAFAGIGGVLYATKQRNIFPNNFTLEVSIEVLSLVIIGGMGSIPGVIMGAIALIGLPEVLRELATYRVLAFGALLITMVIVRPEGLLPAPTTQLRERAQALVQGRSPTTQEDETK
jgi:ABC-type branched-subunit amino acid transport system permease subunit